MKKTNGDGAKVWTEYTAYPYSISGLGFIQTKSGIAAGLENGGWGVGESDHS